MTAMHLHRPRRPTRHQFNLILFWTGFLLFVLICALAAGWINPGNWFQFELNRLYGASSGCDHGPVLYHFKGCLQQHLIRQPWRPI
jgi:hypothetical protein